MTGPSSWVRAVVDHPVGCAPPSTFFAGVTLLPSKSMTSWAPGIMCISRLHSHGSHPRMPTYRRRGCPVVARLASGLRVFALAGRDSHPLDGYSEFQNVTDHVLPFRPAFPGRFHRSPPVRGQPQTA